MNLSIFTKSEHAKTWPTGLQGQLPREEYDNIGALSCTVLKKWIALEATPTEFAWWLKERWTDSSSSAALAMGSALDCLLLDYEEFPKRFVVFTKDGPKRITEAHRDANPDKIVLTHEQRETVVAMANALNSSPHTNEGKDLQICTKRVAIAKLWDVPFKCEFDLWSKNTDSINDIKSARDVSRVEFGKVFVNFGYDYQASLYLHIARAIGHDKRCFNFICVKNEPPHTVKVYRFRPFENEKHYDIYSGCITRLREATGSLLEAMANQFADDMTWEDLSVPSWAIAQRKNDTLLLT
jgi:hypothetical protein